MKELIGLFRGRISNSMFITMICWLLLALIQVLFDNKVLNNDNIDFFVESVKKSKESHINVN